MAIAGNRGSRIPAAANVALVLCATAAAAADLFVAPSGDDANAGTKEKPFATLERALDAARKMGPMGGDGLSPHVVLLPGDYFLSKTIELNGVAGLSIEGLKPDTAVLHGGRPVKGWRRDGERFWCAELPGVKEGAWDFRALVVNGRLADRARLPAEGTFTHRSVFDVRWLSSVGGGWERAPATNELTTMVYDPKDIPATLEPRNAEVRVYHMWDESLVGVVSNDTTRQTLVFSPPAKSPPGAFGVKKYVIFNTREGMTRPGQWYLDRAAGRVVYWPLPGEDVAKSTVIAPVVETILRVTQSSMVALENLVLQATTTPLGSGGFGAYAFRGALELDRVTRSDVVGLEIRNVGGQGIVARKAERLTVSDCRIHATGACGMKLEGSRSVVEGNHVHDVGRHYPSAVALSVSHSGPDPAEMGFHVLRNEVHDTPYSGMIGSGGNHRFEENLISRVMREMHDGGAIYGGMKRSILRGNVVRDVVKVGEGYGVSAYYLDEGAEDCVVERNVSVGVERPTHNHIARNLVIRDNVFIAETNMTLSFQRSAGCTFAGNTLVAPGKITIGQPGAIAVWTNNLVIREGLGTNGAPQRFTIDDAMPPSPAPARRSWTPPVVRVATPPALDGEIGWDEWPGPLSGLDRDLSRWNASGAPAFAELAWDNRCLYVAVNVASFDVALVKTGSVWGVDDGAEVCVRGSSPDGSPATFVLRGYAGGALQSITDGGAPAKAAAALGRAARYAGKPYGRTRGGWRGEWAIPFDALGLKPAPGLKIPFNVGVLRAEDGTRRCLEGTLGEPWRLDEAAVLQLK